VADFLDGTPSDQPRRGAIHMRYADHPWGPFSEATPVIFREQLGPSMHCDAPSSAASGGCDLDRLESDPKHSYDPGAWAPTELDFPGCLTDTPVPAQPNLYAPNILGAWTESRMGERGYGHAATLYVNVSTWAPYQVLLTRLHVRLP